MVASAARKKRRQSAGLNGRRDGVQITQDYPDIEYVSVDYEALETRLMAQASREPITTEDVRAFINAASTPGERSRRKALVFGSQYGSSVVFQARCGWCGASPAMKDYAAYCTAHAPDSELLALAFLSARWRLEPVTYEARRRHDALLKGVSNVWIIF